MRVLRFTCEADGVATAARGLVRAIGFDCHDAVVYTNETGTLGRAAIDVVDVAVGGIILLLDVRAG